MTSVLSTTEKEMRQFILTNNFDEKFMNLLFEIKESYIKENLKDKKEAYIAHDGILSEVIEQLKLIGEDYQ